MYRKNVVYIGFVTIRGFRHSPGAQTYILCELGGLLYIYEEKLAGKENTL